MRITALLLTVLLTCGIATAQETDERRPITLREAVMRPFLFVDRGLTGLSWHPDGEHVSFLDRTDAGPALVLAAAANGDRKTIVTASELAAAAKKAKIDAPGQRALAGASWSADGKSLRMVASGRVLHYDVAAKTLTSGLSVPADAEAVAWSDGDGHVSFVKEHDIHVTRPDGSTHRVTEGGFEFLTHGVAVSRVEFGIKDGMWWDPTGRRLAFYREDLRPIQEYPYIDWNDRPARHRRGRYPMAGRAGSRVKVGIYDSRDDSVVWLATDPATDEYLTNVTWSPDGETLHVAHVNRAQDRMDLRRYKASDGSLVGTIFSETDAQWVEPEQGLVFLSDGTGDFIRQGCGDGFEALYLHDASGRPMQRLTTGAWDITGLQKVDLDAGRIYFTGTGSIPIENHLFHAPLPSAETRAAFRADPDAAMLAPAPQPTRLTDGNGRHDARISPNGRYVLDSHSAVGRPRVTEITRSGEETRIRIDEARDPWKSRRGGREEPFTVTTEDGVDLYGHLILPPDLDEKGKYPVLLYVYGGPHSQLVKDEFGGGAGWSSPWFHYMANQGIIVIRVDGRGTDNRGIDFEQAIHRDMGTLEVNDQIAALEALFERPYVDRTRVGVHGWSYGGFMTLSLMTRAAKYFSCGISGAPVTDWAFYETGYGERYMDTPEENPEGYERSRPATHIENLEGRLLVVHGSSDETVVWQHTIDFVDACIEADKEVEYMVYPGQLHGLRGKHRWHFYQKMTRFFLEELKGR